MNNSVIVLDSNSVIYQLNKKLDHTVVLAAYPGCEKHISVITELEALSKPGMTADEETEAKAFLSTCVIEEISPAIKQAAISLRRTKKLRLPDAIIAATALALNAPILSNDTDLSNLQWPGYEARKPL
jgi:predicted nucleic acid-binding protein